MKHTGAVCITCCMLLLSASATTPAEDLQPDLGQSSVGEHSASDTIRVADAESTTAPSPVAQRNFVPRESISADSAIAFPSDI